MVLVMAFLMAMMLGVVICLCCHIRSQRKRRQEDAVKLMKNQKSAIDMSESDSERVTPGQKKHSAVVGGAPESHLTTQ